MISVFRQVRGLWPILKVGLGVLLLILSACGGDPDTVVVDFSKKVPAKKPLTSKARSHLLKVAVAAMVSPKETFVYYHQLLDYVGKGLGQEVEFIQRKTYREISELLAKGDIDIAFICSGPYANGKEKYGFQLLATPEIQGSHFYRSFLIVNKRSPFRRLEDLKAKVFAFTDPESNTGRLVPTYWLSRIGETPEEFFSKIVYTYSHDNSILAVARSLVDGASVDGLIWDYYDQRSPAFTAKTRIIRKSEPFGIPPVVASSFLSSEQRERIKSLLLSMHQDPEGRAVLDALMIDRFVAPREEWYESIKRMASGQGASEKEPRVSAQY